MFTRLSYFLLAHGPSAWKVPDLVRLTSLSNFFPDSSPTRVVSFSFFFSRVSATALRSGKEIEFVLSTMSEYSSLSFHTHGACTWPRLPRWATGHRICSGKTGSCHKSFRMPSSGWSINQSVSTTATTEINSERNVYGRCCLALWAKKKKLLCVSFFFSEYLSGTPFQNSFIDKLGT